LRHFFKGSLKAFASGPLAPLFKRQPEGFRKRAACATF